MDELKKEFLEFAREETQLFKLLFIKDMDLDMVKAKDYHKEIGNEKKAEDPTNKLSLSRDDIETMVMDLLTALAKKEKPDWDLPV